MSAKEVKETEEIVNKMAAKNEEVYARDTSLAVAKSFQGLRAVFDEVSWRVMTYHGLLYNGKNLESVTHIFSV